MFEKLKYNFLLLPGWRTNRKLVVIESDDWGSIRVPSRSIYEEFIKKRMTSANIAFNQYDTLANSEDLALLFEILSSVKDKNRRPAILTANTIMTNPDFNKIRESKFENYFYERFTETLKRHYANEDVFCLWREGINNDIFRPQFHGREHVNISRWMNALKMKIGEARLAFDYGFLDLRNNIHDSKNAYLYPYDSANAAELEYQMTSLIEGLKLFEELFGYKSLSFIAPGYIWGRNLAKTTHELGVKGFQGIWYQFEPIPNKDHKVRRIFHYTGQLNILGQTFIVRNAHFEPSQYPKPKYIDEILKRAQIVFNYHKPLVISTHRVNFIGSIDKSNRDQNLKTFGEILRRIVKKWPDVEFVSTDELIKIILSS